MEKLRRHVAETRPGKTVAVKVFRDGGERKLQVEIGELETAVAAGGQEPSSANLGMTIRTLTSDLRQQLDCDNDVRGVVVTAVEPFGPADRAGLRVKDIVTSVQGQDVEDVDDFRDVLRRYDLTEGVRLNVLTEGTKRFAFLKIGK
jgi:serine protease Do